MPACTSQQPAASAPIQHCPVVASHSNYGRRASALYARRCSGYQRLAHGPSKGTRLSSTSIAVYAAQSRPLSFNQRLRSIRGKLEEQKKRTRQALASLPPVQAIAQALHVVQQKLEPLYRLQRLIRAWWNVQLDKYGEFGGEEVKRQWEWRRRTEAERNLWVSIGTFLGVSFLTVAWMTITPASLFWGALLPVHVSWIVYDRPLLSPIFVTLLPMWLVKFPLGYPLRLF